MSENADDENLLTSTVNEMYVMLLPSGYVSGL